MGGYLEDGLGPFMRTGDLGFMNVGFFKLIYCFFLMLIIYLRRAFCLWTS
jgi:hypothetical protein